MHAEWVEIEKQVIKNIIAANKDGRRIIAVGTTSVRSLESLFQKEEYHRFLPALRSGRNDKKKNIHNSIPSTRDEIRNFDGWVDIFIYPGYKFKIVDAMITNFHLPKSTLLMLVSALAGQENIKKTYKAAISKKYRFYSYGDAMFIC
jgi:S-adenosylmethionine:tRNA ribosyltransferase-isomerase